VIFARSIGDRQLSRGSVLSIGAFDGLHRGHQALLQAQRARADALGLDACVLSFEPLPREFFRAPNFLRLTPCRQKFKLLQQLDPAVCVLARFNQRMMQTSPEAFLRALVHSFAPAEIWVGADFRFGHQRSGTLDTLRAFAAELGFRVQVFDAVMQDAERISASRIRSALLAGDVAAANAMLGRAFCYSGRVIAGQQLARTLGFPTANIAWLDAPAALYGVYAVRVSGAGMHQAAAVASLGVRPVVAGTQCWLEVHLVDFHGDLYGQRLNISFHEKLRGELHFPDLEALSAQVQRDIAHARALLA
jgi:riboflavin kinase / FMN adenylyltransferase